MPNHLSPRQLRGAQRDRHYVGGPGAASPRQELRTSELPARGRGWFGALLATKEPWQLARLSGACLAARKRVEVCAARAKRQQGPSSAPGRGELRAARHTGPEEVRGCGRPTSRRPRPVGSLGEVHFLGAWSVPFCRDAAKKDHSSLRQLAAKNRCGNPLQSSSCARVGTIGTESPAWPESLRLPAWARAAVFQAGSPCRDGCRGNHTHPQVPESDPRATQIMPATKKSSRALCQQFTFFADSFSHTYKFTRIRSTVPTQCTVLEPVNSCKFLSSNINSSH